MIRYWYWASSSAVARLTFSASAMVSSSKRFLIILATLRVLPVLVPKKSPILAITHL
ncbi:hypothetical protein D3C81_1869410 [compost metagenome]